MTIAGGTAPDIAALESRAPDRIVNSVRTASRRTGVEFAYLLEKAAVESGFDAEARADTSSAAGLYQFTDQTWLDMVRRHGDKYGLGGYADAMARGPLDPETRQQVLSYRDDPRIAAAMAGEYARANQERLESALGREATGTDLYMAHFLGGSGAEKFLQKMESDPNARAADLLPQAAAANKPVFYENGRARSVKEIYDHFAARFAGPERHARLRMAGPEMPAPAPEPAAPSTPDDAVATAFAFSGDYRPADPPPSGARHPLAMQAMLMASALDPLSGETEKVI